MKFCKQRQNHITISLMAQNRTKCQAAGRHTWFWHWVPRKKHSSNFTVAPKKNKRKTLHAACTDKVRVTATPVTWVRVLERSSTPNNESKESNLFNWSRECCKLSSETSHPKPTSTTHKVPEQRFSLWGRHFKYLACTLYYVNTDRYVS